MVYLSKAPKRIKNFTRLTVEDYLIKREKTVMQNSNEEYRELRMRMEQILAELDRLKLGTVAVHIDYAMRRLEGIIEGRSKTLGGIKAE